MEANVEIRKDFMENPVIIAIGFDITMGYNWITLDLGYVTSSLRIAASSSVKWNDRFPSSWLLNK
jgi:hypothetical protein